MLVGYLNYESIKIDELSDEEKKWVTREKKTKAKGNNRKKLS